MEIHNWCCAWLWKFTPTLCWPRVFTHLQRVLVMGYFGHLGTNLVVFIRPTKVVLLWYGAVNSSVRSSVHPMDLLHLRKKIKKNHHHYNTILSLYNIISRHYRKSFLRSQIYHGYEELSTDPIWRRQERRSKYAIPRTPRQPPAILSSTPQLVRALFLTPIGLVMAGCWQIYSILTNIGRRNSIRILN